MKTAYSRLSKKESKKELHYDFTDCPDLAQTVSVVCAAKNIKGYFTGLESLRIKETDRIKALQNELSKIGADLREEDPEHWTLIPIAIATEPSFILNLQRSSDGHGFCSAWQL